MISTGILLLFLGLIVFGPRKTLEFAQEIGRLIAHLKRSVGQLIVTDGIQISQLHPAAENAITQEKLQNPRQAEHLPSL
jgi:Sec-independent protein translocase protein TatA